MIQYTFRAIDKWPDARKQTPMSKRRSWPGKFLHEETLRLLTYELTKAGASGQVVIEAFVTTQDVRQDGMLRSDSRPSAPGIVLRFTGRNGAVTMPCDRFSHWKDNLRAIAKTLEALRAIDRWGTTYSGEQYRGWTALPAARETMSTDDAAAELSKHAPFVTADWIRTDLDAFKTAHKVARQKTHPDAGGTDEAFKRVEEAADILKRHFGIEESKS